MKAVAPLGKAEMIECSLRCFYWALFGMIPFLGIPMAVGSSIFYQRVVRGRGATWNPAHRYLFWGGVLARLSLLLLIPWTMILIVIIRN
jgi:hypothetical protein